MTSQITDTPEPVSEDTDRTRTVVQYAAPAAKNTPADVVDRAGNAILELVNRAAYTAQSDLQAAREIADNLTDQLRTAHSRINELEANVRYYQGRAERAEKWMHQISSEVQQRFLGADSNHAHDGESARRMTQRLQNQITTGAMPRQREPSFLRRLSRQ